MYRDPIVEEVRKAREDYARQFNFNLREIAADLQRRSQERGVKTVKLPPSAARRRKRRNDQLSRPVRAGCRGFLPRARAADDPRRAHRAGYDQRVSDRGLAHFCAVRGAKMCLSPSGSRRDGRGAKMGLSPSRSIGDCPNFCESARKNGTVPLRASLSLWERAGSPQATRRGEVRVP